MRTPDMDWMIVKDRQREDLARAAQYRLIKQAEEANRPARTPVFVRLSDGLMLWLAHSLSAIGGRMLAWSCRLQYRYELLSDGVTEHRPSPCA